MKHMKPAVRVVLAALAFSLLSVVPAARRRRIRERSVYRDHAVTSVVYGYRWPYRDAHTMAGAEGRGVRRAGSYAYRGSDDQDGLRPRPSIYVLPEHSRTEPCARQDA